MEVLLIYGEMFQRTDPSTHSSIYQLNVCRGDLPSGENADHWTSGRVKPRVGSISETFLVDQDKPTL